MIPLSLPQKIILAILSFLFLVSILLGVIFPPTLQEYRMIFPDAATNTLVPESQLLPRQASQAQEIEQFLGALLLGPVRVLSEPLFPSPPVIDAFFFDEQKKLVTVSLGIDTVQILADYKKRPLETIEDLIMKNIKTNFPGIDDVTLLIGGNVPGAPVFSLQKGGENQETVKNVDN